MESRNAPLFAAAVGCLFVIAAPTAHAASVKVATYDGYVSWSDLTTPAFGADAGYETLVGKSASLRFEYVVPGLESESRDIFESETKYYRNREYVNSYYSFEDYLFGSRDNDVPLDWLISATLTIDGFVHEMPTTTYAQIRSGHFGYSDEPRWNELSHYVSDFSELADGFRGEGLMADFSWSDDGDPVELDRDFDSAGRDGWGWASCSSWLCTFAEEDYCLDNESVSIDITPTRLTIGPGQVALAPIPLPPALPLLGVGLLALGVMRRRPRS
jgi:hypothetical protein